VTGKEVMEALRVRVREKKNHPNPLPGRVRGKIRRALSRRMKEKWS